MIVFLQSTDTISEHQLLITPTVNRDDRPLKPAAGEIVKMC